MAGTLEDNDATLLYSSMVVLRVSVAIVKEIAHVLSGQAGSDTHHDDRTCQPTGALASAVEHMYVRTHRQTEARPSSESSPESRLLSDEEHGCCQ